MRIGLIPRHEIVAVESGKAGIAVPTIDRFAEAERHSVYDVVVLATGYERNLRHHFLEPIARFVAASEAGRDYCLSMREGFAPRIYL